MNAKHRPVAFLVFVFAIACVFPAAADQVTDWDAIMFQAALVAPATSPLVMSRNAAIVQSSVFDALNGIERRYTSIYVQPAAPRGASRRAAVVQAAYAALLHLYPSQASTLDLQREASLDAIASDSAAENSESIARGIEWGQTVADAIWSWRLTDGITPAPPPFLGGTDYPGEWRPTPPAFLPGAGPQFAYMTPWVITSPAQFRPAGPPALDSARYIADVAETQSRGSFSSSTRSADQTLSAKFWNVSTAPRYWHRIALNLAAERHFTMSENSRLLALVSLAMGDAAIACWDAKYYYVFWRPITAIRMTDPTWTPLLITPAFPEYPSGHSTVSGAAAAVISSYFGDNTPFSVDSDVMLGVTRSFAKLAHARAEIENARVFGGIHFRSACDDGDATGTAVGHYVIEHAVFRLNGQQ